MAKSKALVKSEGKLKQLLKSVKDMEKRIKVLTLKDAKAEAAQKKAAAKNAKKKVVSKKKVTAKKTAVVKKKASAKKRVVTKKRTTKKASKVVLTPAVMSDNN